MNITFFYIFLWMVKFPNFECHLSTCFNKVTRNALVEAAPTLVPMSILLKILKTSHTVVTIDVWHRIIHKRCSQKREKIIKYFPNLLKIKLPTYEISFIVSTIGLLITTQYKVYFAYVFLNCWNFEKLNLRLSNHIFK
jgi:hypothetical protein